MWPVLMGIFRTQFSRAAHMIIFPAVVAVGAIGYGAESLFNHRTDSKSAEIEQPVWKKREERLAKDA